MSNLPPKANIRKTTVDRTEIRVTSNEPANAVSASDNPDSLSAQSNVKSKSKVNCSRWISCTLEDGSTKHIHGTRIEFDQLLVLFRSISSGLQYMVMTVESHEEPDETGRVRLHLHILAYYTNTLRETQINNLRVKVDAWKGSSTNQTIFGKGLYTNWLGYIAKYCVRDGTLPYIYTTNKVVKGITQPHMTLAIVFKHAEAYNFDQLCKETAETEGIVISNKAKEYREFIDFISNDMKNLELSINPWTKRIHGQYNKEQYIEYCFTKTSKFGQVYPHRHDELIRILNDTSKYGAFPAWNPLPNIIEVSDGYYDLNTGEILPLSLKLCPLSYSPEYTISEIQKDPIHYISIVYDLWCETSRVMGYREHMGRQYRDKKHRDKNLAIIGEPESGKTLIVQPFVEFFKEILGEWTEDGGFSVSNIAHYPKFWGNEINPMSEMKISGQKVMKEMNEGSRCECKVKHEQPTIVIPKNGIYTYNGRTRPESDYERGSHFHAMRTRIACMFTLGKVDTKIPHHSLITDPLSLLQIAVWHTRKLWDPIPYQHLERSIPDDFHMIPDDSIIENMEILPSKVTKQFHRK